MAVSKCNITGLVKNKIDGLKHGIIYDYDENEDLILDNYADFLGCTTISRETCNPDNCSNPTIDTTCSLTIDKLSVDIDADNGKLVFFVDEADIHNYKSPLVYQWSFDDTDFMVANGINSSTLSLFLKPNKSLEALVSPVTLTIEDDNNCRTTITCYLTPSGLQCSGYIPCLNPIRLQVINKFVRCSGGIRLTITKKL